MYKILELNICANVKSRFALILIYKFVNNVRPGERGALSGFQPGPGPAGFGAAFSGQARCLGSPAAFSRYKYPSPLAVFLLSFTFFSNTGRPLAPSWLCAPFLPTIADHRASTWLVTSLYRSFDAQFLPSPSHFGQSDPTAAAGDSAALSSLIILYLRATAAVQLERR